MKPLTILSGKYTIQDQDGNTIVEAPIMEMYYLLCDAVESFVGSKVDKMKNAAKVFNTEYGTNIGWGDAANMINMLDDEIGAAKKNFSTTQE
jgi:hypothetical protein